MTSEHLRFSPAILQRLGEELTPHFDQRVLELVRNSYDADATICRIRLEDDRLVVDDDGIGMTADQIRDGWLVVGRSSKSSSRRTPRGRLQVGDKGLGRLAALRMGARCVVTTRPASDPGCQYRLEIDWSEFDRASTVEAVAIPVVAGTSDLPSGTEVTVEGISRQPTRREVRRLARSLLLLADPFGNTSGGFIPTLAGTAFTDLEKRVRDSYFQHAAMRLNAKVEHGLGHAEVHDQGEVRWRGSHADLSSTETPYSCPDAEFELWVFILEGKRFTESPVTLGEVRDWLEVVGGVHLYHRNLRVPPYGDPGHDWLDMNLARVRSPEARPSTNTAVGRVVVEDPADVLLQKTDRTGFVESEAFSELRRFAVDSLEWMATERLREAEARRQAERPHASAQVLRARRSLDRVVTSLPQDVAPQVERAVVRLERAHTVETKTLRDDLQLYRTLATVGTTVAVFAHESAKPAGQIMRLAELIGRRVKAQLPELYDAAISRPVRLIVESARSIDAFSSLPLKFLSKDKRRWGRIDVNEVITSVTAQLGPFFEESRIAVQLELDDARPEIRGSVAALEAIVANLMTNSTNAFAFAGARRKGRLIRIETVVAGSRVVLRVSDNGPGIRNIGIGDIWLPGRSTRVGGTGLGLTIVRDTATDLGGQALAVANGGLGGAEFIIDLPVRLR
jgi:signal transduction histidine kinase